MIKDESKRQHYENFGNDPEIRQRRLDQGRSDLARTRAWLSQYKLERGCIDCGYNEHAVALDLDHTNGKTSEVVRRKSIAAAFAEIQDCKCVVRCRNCHRIKSHCDRAGIAYDPGIIPQEVSTTKITQFKADYKIKRGCAKCGYNRHFSALDFHHIGEKGIQVSLITTIERFILEMALFPCEILCARCHQIHHAEETDTC